MELQAAPPAPAPAGYAAAAYERRPVARDAVPAVRWLREWVPQELIATGGKCMVLKWVKEDMFKAMQERLQEPEPEEQEPEPATEVLFLCSFEGCGKTFIDVSALRKHSHIHGEKQYVCHYDGCGKKFLDSSKLKRHFLIHTGERAYMCTYEGCGKAFSLDFNLRAHMRTHSQENYHICPYEDCGKRFAHSYKLQAHIKSQHEKFQNTSTNVPKPTPTDEKMHAAPKPTPAVYSDRPYACPFEGCGKSYIHEYKLKLHLRREHPGHNLENGKRNPAVDHDVDDGTEQDLHLGKGATSKVSKRSKASFPSAKAPPSKVVRKASTPPTNFSVSKKHWPVPKEMYDDSEETEEDCENAEEDGGWRYQSTNGDDEETEDED